MLILYEKHKLTTIKFRFKLDLAGTDYLPHIYVRHLITPEIAIQAYLNITTKHYNQRHKRWESYSKNEDVHLYYLELPNNEIFIISAFNI
jgi:hypothetical protein